MHASYRVLSALKHDQTRYAAGDTVMLSAAEAATLPDGVVTLESDKLMSDDAARGVSSPNTIRPTGESDKLMSDDATLIRPTAESDKLMSDDAALIRPTARRGKAGA